MGACGTVNNRHASQQRCSSQRQRTQGDRVRENLPVPSECREYRRRYTSPCAVGENLFTGHMPLGSPLEHSLLSFFHLFSFVPTTAPTQITPIYTYTHNHTSGHTYTHTPRRCYPHYLLRSVEVTTYPPLRPCCYLHTLYRK